MTNSKKWNLPPPADNKSRGHMDIPDGIYLQNMNIVKNLIIALPKQFAMS